MQIHETMQPRSSKDALQEVWRDLTEEPTWKYEEQPPLLLAELTALDLFEVGDSGLARAHWFWSRRPKLELHEDVALIVVALCVLLALTIAFVKWPQISLAELAAETTILLAAVAVAVGLILSRLRFLRWRREYELSVDRLIRTIHFEV
jgi:hypothetical protein